MKTMDRTEFVATVTDLANEVKCGKIDQGAFEVAIKALASITDFSSY